jgi:hypothetical protein
VLSEVARWHEKATARGGQWLSATFCSGHAKRMCDLM